MQRIIIAAMSTERVIGRGDGMPWQVPAEYQHFLHTVRGQTLIMGRRSWEIFGADVTSAHNVVISRSADLAGVTVVGSLEAALAQAETYGLPAYIAGGASIYQQALAADVVDEMVLSTIHGTFTGDAYFPDFDRARWTVTAQQEFADYTVTRYQRRR